MAAVTDDALCIRNWDWSETSQTVSVFSRDHGVVRALAKGSKRPKGAFSGGIELLARAQATFILKPQSELALLTGWDLLETFPALRRSLAAHNAGLYIADLIQHFVTDRDPHPGLYDFTLISLRSLDELSGGAGPATALLAFQWSLLAEAGYRPTLDGEAPQTGSATRAQSLRFSPTAGGLVDPDEVDPSSTAWGVRPETIEVLRRVAAGSTLSGQSAPVIERASRLLASYIRYILGREPSTLAVVFGRDLPR